MGKIRFMQIKRDLYLNRLISRMNNGSVKVITGIRRCGKSYLLFKLFSSYLTKKGVDKSHIIKLSLDDIKYEKLLKEPMELYNKIITQTKKSRKKYYVILDEIQYIKNFESLVNALHHVDNIDLYITGSNSKFLSSDILTSFRGRGDEVRVRPLTFGEFKSAHKNISWAQAWKMYVVFGGMPELLSRAEDEQKITYLQNLVNKVYLGDIVERNNVMNTVALENIFNCLCSSVGSLTNPLKIENTLKSTKHKDVSYMTVKKYLDFLEDSFLFESARRYDVKGRKYLSSITKYYAADVGLRNAYLNFRQLEESHIMENIIYNELRTRGFLVDIGIVPVRETKKSKQQYSQLEIDFVANKGNNRYYIQSALEIPNEKKEAQEKKSLTKAVDSFKKILVVKDDIYAHTDDNGILTVGIQQFLTDYDILEE